MESKERTPIQMGQDKENQSDQRKQPGQEDKQSPGKEDQYNKQTESSAQQNDWGKDTDE